MDRPKRSAAAAPAPLPPDDALVEILSLVPAKSLCRFKCVSKAWRDLITDRLRCNNKLPQTLQGFFVFDYSDNGGGGGSGSKGGGGGVSSEDRVLRGYLMNTLGRSVPLASFSFLADQPGIESICLVQACNCNGLLLFGHKRKRAPGTGTDTHYSLGYIVCNPATGQWAAVPNSGSKPFSSDAAFTYLVFDPAVSSHFRLVEFWTGTDDAVLEEVRAYSSETGVWCETKSEWNTDDEFIAFYVDAAFLSGKLHFSVCSLKNDGTHQELIVAVDAEGNNCRTISGPEKQCVVAFVGQSQGCLHYIYMSHRFDTNAGEATDLSVWALQDYDAGHWVLKHTVTFLELFGRTGCTEFDFRVVAIHPDRNLIFFVQRWDMKLKSYDMDGKEVRSLRTLGAGPLKIVPYVPYFAESAALASKH